MLQKNVGTQWFLILQLDRKRKEESSLKEKIMLLERQVNNLGEHCDYLKHRLKVCDPSYKRGEVLFI